MGSSAKKKTQAVNDIDLKKWKEYSDIITDSLWLIDKRDTSGVHEGWYWGNFVPQIPYQLMRRYTREREIVIDGFLGSGTTLIECRRLGRHGIGIELNGDVAKAARKKIRTSPNPYHVRTHVITGNASTVKLGTKLKNLGTNQAHLLILHPPYHNIIQFSSDLKDLSTAPSTEAFVSMFGDTLDNLLKYLAPRRYLAVVIGDKYEGGEWIPLGFYLMEETMKRGLKLKSIVVKNFDETRGKRNQRSLWRYRALHGGFYVFKHEYIFIFENN